jgi:hypothetical protein
MATEQVEGTQTRVKAANVSKGHTAVRKASVGIWGEVRDGAGKRVMECEMCTENNKEGSGWERQWQ